MKKYGGYYYSTKLAETSARNNTLVIKKYSWKIYNKEKEVLEESEELIEGKREAEIFVEEKIQEYYS